MLRNLNRFLHLKPARISYYRAASKLTKNVTYEPFNTSNERFSMQSLRAEKYTPTITNDQNDSDHLKVKAWIQHNLQAYPDFNSREMKLAHTKIDALNQIKTKSHYISKFGEAIRAFLTTSLFIDKFIENPTNWSLLMDNIDIGPFDIKDKHEKYSKFANLIVNSIQELQTKESSLSSYYLDMAESFNFHFLQEQYSITNQRDLKNLKINDLDMIYFLHIQYIRCNFLDTEIRRERSFFNQSEKFQNQLKRLDIFTNLLMKRFDSLDSVPIEIRGQFFRIFSFNEPKWNYSVQHLLDLDVADNSLKSTYLTFAIKGALNFDRIDIVEKLIVKASEFNKIAKIRNGYKPPNWLFNDYFLMYGDRLEHHFKMTMSLWQKIKFVPSKDLINSLVNFLKNNQTSKCRYEILNGSLKDKGFTIGKTNNDQEKGYLLPEKIFDNRELSEIADVIKQQFILGNPQYKYLNEQKMIELDEILEHTKYDYVLDGMNIVYSNRNYGINLNHIDLTVQEIRKRSDKKILVIFKEHMMNTSNRSAIRFLEREQNCDFFFLNSATSQDDKFIVYASLKSGNSSFVVSRDIFKFLYDIDSLSYQLKEWMMSRKIQFQTMAIPYEYVLMFPPQYEIQPHQVNSSTWLVPYHDTHETNNDYKTPVKCLLINKIK